MEGVRILAETAIYDTVYSWGFDPLLIFMVICLAFSVYILVGSIINQELFITLISFILCATCVYGSICVASMANSEEVFSHMEYKVIVEDNVELKDFINHYEILDQEGEIYTVKEKVDINE